MKLKGTFVMTAVILISALGMTQAAHAGYFADRQQQQARRIQQGIASGQITPWEAEQLYKDQYELRRLKRYFIADGDFSNKEGFVLLKHLEHSSDLIDRYTHNRHRTAPHCPGTRDTGHFAWR